MRVAIGILASSCVFYLAGCSGGPLATSVKTGPVQGAAIQGVVHGGQAIVSGGRIYLYAANNTGYGNASISLLTANVLTQTPAGGKDTNGNYYVTTASDGSWAITGDYTCPARPRKFTYMEWVALPTTRARTRLSDCWPRLEPARRTARSHLPYSL